MGTGAHSPVPKGPVTPSTYFWQSHYRRRPSVYTAGSSTDNASLRGRTRRTTRSIGDHSSQRRHPPRGPTLSYGTYYAVVAVIARANRSTTVNGDTTTGRLGAPRPPPHSGYPATLGTNEQDVTGCLAYRIANHPLVRQSTAWGTCVSDISHLGAAMRESRQMQAARRNLGKYLRVSRSV
jgi:hypothetical protein